MKATIERGKWATPHAVAQSSAATRIVAGPGLSSRDRIISALAAFAPAAPQLERQSRSLSDDFAQETLGAEDQDEDQKGQDVLVLGAEGPARQQREVRGREGFEESQHEAAEHGARDIADAAE